MLHRKEQANRRHPQNCGSCKRQRKCKLKAPAAKTVL
ncbi:MAG TPA: hypothetical protein DEP60_02270 [Ruminococcaceae bacterium]|nr:hypothetical protein [Oscillospiraceae bacterium]